MTDTMDKDISFLANRIRKEANRMKMMEKGLTFWLILMAANGESRLP